MFIQQEHGPAHEPQPNPLRTAPMAVRLQNAIYPSDFLRHLEGVITRHKDHSLNGSLLLVSIDNLAMIINGYGHDVSETVVQALMKLIGDMLSNDDHIERLQRDQLGIILSSSYPEESERMAGRIANILQNYGRDNFATASLHIIGAIGCVHFPNETQDAGDALDKAYVALNSSQEGFYRTFQDTKREADMCRQQMGLASYLYGAFRENRLRLAWQPVIESATGNVSHYEALLRLVGLNGKITSAGALIPIAEQMGLIESIDSMVLEMVVKELRASENVSLAFNVSNMTTDNPAWIEHIQALVSETPDIASRMIVEITETAAHRDLRRVAYFVAALQSIGIQVALDDFGSGYTSFRQLKALSVDMVKIDGVFIKDIAQNADNRFFVRTLLDFTRGFGLTSVAEFVETGEIAKLLMEQGVDYMQGYYFGKPENNRRWLDEGEYKSD